MRFSLPSRLFGTWTQQLSAATLRADLVAGLLGALLVLPQGIAFATLAGLPPEYGLYSAIVPCAVAALFGSSWHVMSGPTNANSLALFAMLTPLAAAGSREYVELALAVTIMVGLMQWGVGALRLGTLANFISPAALLGFTGGAALLIALHSIPSLLGLVGASGHGTAALLGGVFSQLGDVHPGAMTVAAVTLAVAQGVKVYNRRWPFMLLGLVAGTAAATVINRWGAAWGLAPVTTIGLVPSVWPPFHLPRVGLSAASDLLGLAFALTIVALAQSISIAKAVAARSGQRIDANREFIGQGLSNIAGGLFSSYVSCGSLNRSMPNLEAGARTPLAAVFSALLLLVLVALSAPLLALIPMAAVSGLLVLVAISLLDSRRWRQLWAHSRTDFHVAAMTFAATVTIRMEIAILLGTIASLGSYLYRTSKPAMRSMGFDTLAPARPFVVVDDNPKALPECRKLKLLRMEGSIYFGAAQHVADRLHALRSEPGAPKHLLVMAKSMNFIDLAGAEVWQAEMVARRAMGGDLWFHRPRPQVLELWERTGFLDALGRDHLFPDKRTAIAAILQRFGADPCAGCDRRVFWECRRGAEAAPALSSPGASG